jgi:hypothetical protein
MIVLKDFNAREMQIKWVTDNPEALDNNFFEIEDFFEYLIEKKYIKTEIVTEISFASTSQKLDAFRYVRYGEGSRWPKNIMK